MNQVKKTELFEWHVDNGANIAEFGGYQMPLWYPAGMKNEHIAVLQSAGLFDTSHMSSVFVEGDGAFDLLQHCFSRNIQNSKNGKCIYGVFLDSNGFVIDDAILYRFNEKVFLVVVNAGMGEDIVRHLKENMSSTDVEISDVTNSLCKFDIQGPMSAKILSHVLADSEKIFQDMGYFSFKGGFHDSLTDDSPVYTKNNARLLISRTGYTGEFGFEIFVHPDHFISLWDSIFQAGQKYDLLCCGLAARDSLRGGAMLPLSHTDIGNWPFINTPWDFALPYNKDKSGFSKKIIGGEALTEKAQDYFTYGYVGYDPRKINAGADSKVIDSEGNEIGTVLTCVTDMGVGRVDGVVFSISSPARPDGFNPKGLCCGFIKVNRKLEFGSKVVVSEGKRKLRVMVTPDIRPDRTAHCPISEMY